MSETQPQTTLTTQPSQPRADKDVEMGNAPPTVDDEDEVDIEHMPVSNDPRKWSPFRKNLSLALVASASMMAGFAVSIQNPAVGDMERDLNATSAQFSLSLSVFIIVQGLMPIVWAAISEIKGRKSVYVSSLALAAVGSIAAAVSSTIQLVIGFRCLQAAGMSAVMTIGAATLADIFDPAERGTKMGIYYIAPQLGPALGPMFGGALTTGFNWRAVFWFLAISSGFCSLCFLLFFRDTFRRERSLTYQNILKRRLKERSKALRKRGAAKGDKNENGEGGEDDNVTVRDGGEKEVGKEAGKEKDIDAGAVVRTTTSSTKAVSAELQDIKLTLKDINPIGPQYLVLRRLNNIIILVASGFQFAFGYLLTYTSSRTLSSAYGYDALNIGLVVLAYGFGKPPPPLSRIHTHKPGTKSTLPPSHSSYSRPTSSL
ncbi:hypothetical protein AX16_004128 [Volvariella volvacea WC 439]|nr:hypothetical protein AX16_004128 [Volvariella volvacea WC 439]